MAKPTYKILALLLLFQLTIHCQMQQKTPEFHTQICHPDNKYDITPVFDYIKTLEKTPAGLPYGSSSGHWGDSGSMWTEQHGTPVGFEITYYSGYEDKYYFTDENFDLTYIKEMTSRCYPWFNENQTIVKEFIYKKEFDDNFQELRGNYSPFSDLIFGFAPQGMVVVWLGYGPNRIELGRYQAKVITDEKRIAVCKKKYLDTYRVDESIYDEQRKKYLLPDASPLQWDNYRIRYNWNYEVTSDNKGFRLLEFDSEFFNGEIDRNYEAILLNPKMKKRAIPEVFTVYWETSAKERYQSKLFFDWDKTNALLKKAGEKNTFHIHINKINSKVEIKLNGEEIELDSIRIYPNSGMRYRNSYPDK